MNRLLVFVLLLIVLVSCKQKQEGDEVKTDTMESEQVPDKGMVAADVNFPIYDFDGLEPLLHREDDHTYIINFWATWCKPCLEELPYFEQVLEEQKNNKVKIILVSLDMPHMWKSNLEPYVAKKGIKSEVVILDDPKQNDWIPKVSEEWGGAIPATLIYNKDKREFYEKGFTYEELNTELNKFIK